MFRASLCPPSGEQDRVLLNVVFCTGCAGCGWLWLAVVLYNAAPQDHSQPPPTHPDRTPHAVGHGLILLMMGVMMSETC